MGELEIYGTLGPSCKNEYILETMLLKGMTGIRLNLSHCNLWDKIEWLESLNKAKQRTKKECQLMIDMHGPELRIGTLNQSLYLINNHILTLDYTILPIEIIQNAIKDDEILLDDGKLVLKVLDVHQDSLRCLGKQGGLLENNKSISIKNKYIKGIVLTSNDIENLKKAKEYHVDSIMQPFVCQKEDLIYVKEVLKELQLDHLKIYAKIENQDGVDHLEDIIPYCDCIVVARGDLGVSIGLKKLPSIQKYIEDVCKKHHHPYMIVTDMLSSMMNHPYPTRAEVNDVFQAVYNGASAIMLTGETAKGKYPEEAMDYFVDIALSAKKEV